MKASTLFEKELCKSMKQTSILNFFKKKLCKIINVILYANYLKKF